MIFLQAVNVEITDLRVSGLSDRKESLWSAGRMGVDEWRQHSEGSCTGTPFVFIVILLMYTPLLTISMILNFAIFT